MYAIPKLKSLFIVLSAILFVVAIFPYACANAEQAGHHLSTEATVMVDQGPHIDAISCCTGTAHNITHQFSSAVSNVQLPVHINFSLLFVVLTIFSAGATFLSVLRYAPSFLSDYCSPGVRLLPMRC